MGVSNTMNEWQAYSSCLIEAFKSYTDEKAMAGSYALAM